MGCNYGDIDNDGYNDFYLGTGSPDYRSIVPNRFFKNTGENSFEEETFSLGLGHIQKGHGIAFADLDNDGDCDIYAVMGGAFEGDVFPNALFENPGNDNHWIKLKLEGVTSNKAAIGARIKLSLANHEQEKKQIYHRVGSGSSFGANPLLAHIGVPKGYEIIDVSIKWPESGNNYRSYGSLQTNSFYKIRQGEQPEQLEVKSFKWNVIAGEHNHTHH